VRLVADVFGPHHDRLDAHKVRAVRETRQGATIQRCGSTWNVLRTFLYTSELIAANPIPMVRRPKLAKTLSKALPTDSVVALLAALSSDPEPRRRSGWIDRDRAVILTALLAGLRAGELLRANVGDLPPHHRRRCHPRSRERRRGSPVRIEPALVEVLEHCLDSRATRFPATPQQPSPGRGLAARPPAAPLFGGRSCA
jgi:integrase/recombinase XerC